MLKGSSGALANCNGAKMNGGTKIRVKKRVGKFGSNGIERREERKGQAEGCHGRRRGQQGMPTDGKEAFGGTKKCGQEDWKTVQ
jgi:hypothetical protein